MSLTYFRGAVGSIQEVYKGFEIKVSQILGSGQRLYRIEGIEGEVTTFPAAYDLINKFLGTYVEPVKTVTEMSVEMFNQLQQGTLAIQENVQLKASLAAEALRLEKLRDTLAGQYQSLLGVQTGVADARDKLQTIPDALATSLDGMKSTLQVEMDKFRALTERIEAGSATLQEQKSLIDSMRDKVKQIGVDIKSITEAYEKALAAKGEVGWIKMIPYYVGAAIAVVVGVKVLDVME